MCGVCVCEDFRNLSHAFSIMILSISLIRFMIHFVCIVISFVSKLDFDDDDDNGIYVKNLELYDIKGTKGGN